MVTPDEVIRSIRDITHYKVCVVYREIQSASRARNLLDRQKEFAIHVHVMA